jgi:hypothetical protein
VSDPDRTPAPLSHFAARVEDDPTFLAHALALYRDRRGLTDDDLAARLGVTPDQLARLKVCGAVADYHDDDRPQMVADIAAATGCDPATLAGILDS